MHKIEISKTGVYHTIGNPEKASKIIFALHGYGQLSKYFIRKFNDLHEDYFIIAPEGLHRFYIKASAGRVGASWMTKENREDDIKDYINLLNNIWDKYNEQYQFSERILLGFSQGGATASRWHQFGKFKAQKFILWASIFPPDLPQNWTDLYTKSDNFFLVGDQDEYYSVEKIEIQKQYFLKNKVNFTVIHYKGNHAIKKQPLLELLK